MKALAVLVEVLTMTSTAILFIRDFSLQIASQGTNLLLRAEALSLNSLDPVSEGVARELNVKAHRLFQQNQSVVVNRNWRMRTDGFRPPRTTTVRTLLRGKS
jgi:hypothetical protein